MIFSDEAKSKAIKFTKAIWIARGQSERDFGSTSRRTLVDKLADTLEGKLAEIAFAQFCNEHGIPAELDFDIYPDEKITDGGKDIINFKKAVDIKATRAYSKWLLVEGHKLGPDAYVLVQVDLPKNAEDDLSWVKDDITAEVLGFAYKSDIVNGKTFRRGDSLYHPDTLRPMNVRLKAELNYGIPIKYLRTNWDEFFRSVDG